MMDVMGVIFANNARLGDLTDKRTMASLPYGGRYRQVDFHLSNMTNAGIRHIGILSRHNYQSLMNHVGSGEEWGLELGEGGLEYLTPYSMSTADSYRGKIDYLNSAMGFLSIGPEDGYVVLADAAVLCNIDLTKVVDSHIQSGRDITVVVKAGVANGVKSLDLALKLDAKGEIEDMAVDYVAPEEYLASMDIFVLSKKWLVKRIHELIARNRFHMDRDFVLGQWQEGTATVHVYPFDGVALFNDSVEEYFRNSMALLEEDVRQALFGTGRRVFTKVRDRVPSYYGAQCSVVDCLVADGCMLEGKVSNSILFRQVTVCPGAELSNCVVMNDTVIGENAVLRYVILDKDVVVRPGSRLIGTPKNPVIIKRGGIV